MLTLLLLLLSLGSLFRISLANQSVNFYPYEPALLVVLISWILKYKNAPFKKITKLTLSIIYFIAALEVSFIVGAYQFGVVDNVIGLLYLTRIFLYFAFFCYLDTVIADKKPKFADLKRGVVLFVFATAVFSIVQYFLYLNLRNLTYLGWDSHQYRMFGLFFDTSVAGAIYGLIFLALYLTKSAIISKKLCVFLLFVYGIFCILTFSRALYFALGASLFIYHIKKLQVKKIIIILALFILGLIIVPKPFGEGVNLSRSFSIVSRMADYKGAISIWKERPVFGVGYNRLRAVKEQKGLIVRGDPTHSGASFHSSFLIVLATSGIVGFVFFLNLLYRLGRTSNFAWGATLFLGVFSLFDNVFLHPFVLILYLALISLFTSRK